MQVTPRYDGAPVLELEVPIGDVAVPLLRQRRRLGAILAALDEEQWVAASRCEGWSVRDVIAHLVGTNQFWTVSIVHGLRGEPTRYLQGFDPVATPAQMVDAVRTLSSADVLSQYQESVEALADVVTGLDDAAWSLVAEAPPGHIAVRAVALHALWDAWTHERDIVVPLGITHTIEPDEVAGSLYYSAAIGPALSASKGSTRGGDLSVIASDPNVAFTVHAGSTVVVTDAPADDGAALLEGDAITLVEGLTFRAPLQHALAASDLWLVGGLSEVFDTAPIA